MNRDNELPSRRSRWMATRTARRILPLTFVAFFLFAASASAHNWTAMTSCTPTVGNTVTMTWSNFASSGTGNGGYNTPPYTITYTPSGGGAPVTLTGSVKFPSSTYTTSVAIPSAAGSIVASSAWTASETTDGNTDGYTVDLSVGNCIAISTSASPGTAAGGSIADSATLSGGDSPTGTITFNLYSASDTTCSIPLASRSVTVDGNGTYTSPAVTENVVGTYQWVASYSGDSNNDPIADACGQASEQVPITPAQPSIATTAGTPTNGTVSDQAVLSGGAAPTGTITFNLYSASDTSCSKSLGSGTATVNGNGTYSSPAIAESTAGTYQWVASYGGDANNKSVAEPCGQAPEQVTVPPPPPPTCTPPGTPTIPGVPTCTPPKITTTQSPSSCSLSATSPSCPLADIATLSGGDSPTGTITVTLYSDAACTTVVSSTTLPVHGDGTYNSPTVTVSTAGTYEWVDSYSGDAHNATATSGCGSEPVPVAPVGAVCAKATHFTGVFGKKGTKITVHIEALGVKSVTVYLDHHEIGSSNHAHYGFFTFTVNTSGLSYGHHTLQAAIKLTNVVCKSVNLQHAFLRTKKPHHYTPTG